MDQIKEWLLNCFNEESYLAEGKYPTVTTPIQFVWRIFWHILFEVKIGDNSDESKTIAVNIASIILGAVYAKLWFLDSIWTKAFEPNFLVIAATIQFVGVIYFGFFYYWDFAKKILLSAQAYTHNSGDIVVTRVFY